MTDIDLRAAWTILPLSAKLFVLLLIVVTAETVYTSSRILAALRSFTPAIPAPSILEQFRNRLIFLRQLHFFMLLAFGLSVSVLALDGYVSLADTNLSGWSFTLHNFQTCCRYSAFVFLVLLLLHSLQWLTSHLLATRH